MWKEPELLTFVSNDFALKNRLAQHRFVNLLGKPRPPVSDARCRLQTQIVAVAGRSLSKVPRVALANLNLQSLSSGS
jgi:hypothetical protein